MNVKTNFILKSLFRCVILVYKISIIERYGYEIRSKQEETMEKIRRSILMGGKTLLLGFALLVIALAATSCEQPNNNVADYITTADGTWEIYTAQGLLDWNAYVTTCTITTTAIEYPNICTSAKLMADISLEGKSWTPVGYYDYGTNIEYYYAGTFDGGGHTISNLKINLPNTNDLGLFGGVAETGVVKDLTLSDVEISGNNYIGGIAGNNYGTIENCSVSGSVSGSSYYVGGIVGYNGGTITACYNIGEVSGYEHVGGIAGYNEGTISDCKTMGKFSGTTRVGGIAGSNKGEISGCTNSAQVSAESNGLTYAGGITGFNSGNISTSCNEKEGTIVTLGGDMACSGGIVGYNRGNITETCNEGSVFAECVAEAHTHEYNKGGFAGGIVGYCAVGTIAASHNEAEVYAKCMLSGEGDYMVCAGGIIGFTDYTESIVACYNSGEFSGESSERPIYLGGIVGYLGPGTTTACCNTGTGKVVEGNWVYNGGITGYINSGTLQSNYWEKGTEETPKFGIGSNVSNDNATEVDGSEGNTWADATEAMNDAITGWNIENNNKCDYHFVQNDGESEPPVLEKGAPATT